MISTLVRSWMRSDVVPPNRRVIGPKAQLDARELRLAASEVGLRSAARERTRRRVLRRAALLARLIDPDRDRNPVVL